MRYLNMNTIAFQMDHLDGINIKTDSSFLIANAFQQRGYNIFFYTPNNLSFIKGELVAKGFFATLQQNNDQYYKKLSDASIDLKNIKLVMIRQDPPFDMNYITNTYLLEHIKDNVLVLNDPASIRSFSEKLSPLLFPEAIPNTVISSDIEILKNFLHEYQEIVLKPLYQHGGQDVIYVNYQDEKANELLNNHIKKFGYVIAQQYIESVKKHGDKRVLMIDGEILGYFQRIPKPGDFRSNTALGSPYQKCELTQEEIAICEEVGILLRSKNLIFAGIDLLDGKLIEINVTSPTGLAILNELYNEKFEERVVNVIERRLGNKFSK